MARQHGSILLPCPVMMPSQVNIVPSPLPHAGDWLSEGIALYSSPDLAAWTAHGLVLKGSDIRVPGRSPPFRCCPLGSRPALPAWPTLLCAG